MLVLGIALQMVLQVPAAGPQGVPRIQHLQWKALRTLLMHRGRAPVRTGIRNGDGQQYLYDHVRGVNDLVELRPDSAGLALFEQPVAGGIADAVVCRLVCTFQPILVTVTAVSSSASGMTECPPPSAEPGLGSATQIASSA